MRDAHPQKAIMAGFTATLLMTALAYLTPLIGLPELDFAALLGAFFTGDDAVVGGSAWWLGMIVHFIDGTLIFALIYAYFVYGILRGSPWLRGLTWGVTLWLLSMMIVMPIMGAGFFASETPEPGLMILAMLLLHMIYGATLGALAGRQATHYYHGVPHAT